jgi:hypothetical protein
MYVAFEAVAIALYCWFLWRWVEWKSLGPNAFPGSPDAFALYFHALSRHQWSTALLEGIWLGGIACAVPSLFAPNQNQSRNH